MMTRKQLKEKIRYLEQSVTGERQLAAIYKKNWQEAKEDAKHYHRLMEEFRERMFVAEAKLKPPVLFDAPKRKKGWLSKIYEALV